MKRKKSVMNWSPWVPWAVFVYQYYGRKSLKSSLISHTIINCPIFTMHMNVIEQTGKVLEFFFFFVCVFAGIVNNNTGYT